MGDLVGELLVMTERQAGFHEYRNALRDEVSASRAVTASTLSALRINHPAIRDYKARLLGGRSSTEDYADWIEFLTREYPPPSRALSLGAGEGRVESYLVSTGWVKELEAIELSPHTVSRVRKSSTALAVDEGDLNFVCLEENTYDFVLCHSILHHLINLEHVMFQIHRSLRPGGTVLIYEYVGEDRWQFDSERLRRIRAHVPEVDLRLPDPWKVRGFESVRSGALPGLILEQFGEPVGRSVNYGGVYFPFIACSSDDADQYMNRVVELDEEWADAGEIAPCYHMGVYRKSEPVITAVQKWTDDEVRQRCMPRAPLGTLMKRKLRRTSAWQRLRDLRHQVGAH